MLQISIFWVVIIILAIHTILTHVFNWLFRISYESNDENMGLTVAFQIVEMALIMVWLYSVLP